MKRKMTFAELVEDESGVIEDLDFTLSQPRPVQIYSTKSKEFKKQKQMKEEIKTAHEYAKTEF